MKEALIWGPFALGHSKRQVEIPTDFDGAFGKSCRSKHPNQPASSTSHSGRGKRLSLDRCVPKYNRRY